MDLFGVRAEDGAAKVAAAVRSIRLATTEAEKIDAANVLKDLAFGGPSRQVATASLSASASGGSQGVGKDALGANFEAFFELVMEDGLEEEVKQTILEVLNEACETQTPADGDTILGSEHTPGTLSGNGAVNFTWLQAPLENTDRILENKAWFESLLEALVVPEQWTRLATIQLLTTLRNNRPQQMEKAVETTPAGMQRLVDVLDASEEVVRNEMLLLLRSLTENNEQLQNFVAFRDGFAKLFQIIDIEQQYDNDMIVVDCLTIMNWVLRGNPLTQKLFAQSGFVSRLEGVLALPRVSNPHAPDHEAIIDGETNGFGMPEDEPATPHSTGEINTDCSPVRLHYMRQAMELLANLVSGLCPEPILDQPWFDPDGDYVFPTSRPDDVFASVLQRHRRQQQQIQQDSAGKNTKGGSGDTKKGQPPPPDEDEIRRRHVAQLRDMQATVGSCLGVVEALAQIAVGLPTDIPDRLRYNSFGSDSIDDLDSMVTWGELRQQAFYLLGDIVCENEAVAAQILHMQVVAPVNSALSSAAAIALQLHEAARNHETQEFPKEERLTTRATVACGATLLALHAATVEEKAAASYFFECLLYNNPTVQISVVGHALTPPPESVTDERFTSLIAPPAGRLLAETLSDATVLTISSATAAQVASSDSDPLNLQDKENQEFEASVVHGRAGRLLETLIRDNSTCQELALRIPAGAPRAGFKRTLSPLMAAAASQSRTDQISNTSGCDLEEGEFFDLYVRDLAQSLRSYGQLQRPRLKTCIVALFRLFALWIDGCAIVAEKLLGSSTSLVLFDAVAGSSLSRSSAAVNGKQKEADIDIEGLAALCVGLSLCAVENTKIRSDVLNLISGRIGFEVFSDRISRLERSPELKLAGLSKRARKQRQQHEQRLHNHPTATEIDLLQIPRYDKRFFDQVQRNASLIQETIINLYTKTGSGSANSAQPMSPEDPTILHEKYENLVRVGEQYKEIIRMQDKEIGQLRKVVKAHNLDGTNSEGVLDAQEIKNMQRTIDNLQQDKDNLQNELQQLRNQCAKQSQELEDARKTQQQQQQQQQQQHVISDELSKAQADVVDHNNSSYEELRAQLQSAKEELRALKSAPEHVIESDVDAIVTNRVGISFLRGALDGIRDEGPSSAIASLPLLAKAAQTIGVHGVDYENWLITAADLAAAFAEYEMAAQILDESLSSNSELESKRELLKRRSHESKSLEDIAAKDTSESASRALREDNARLLLLLANQEMDKFMMLEKLRELGGEDMERTYLRNSAANLHQALFKNSASTSTVK